MIADKLLIIKQHPNTNLLDVSFRQVLTSARIYSWDIEYNKSYADLSEDKQKEISEERYNELMVVINQLRNINGVEKASFDRYTFRVERDENYLWQEIAPQIFAIVAAFAGYDPNADEVTVYVNDLRPQYDSAYDDDGYMKSRRKRLYHLAINYGVPTTPWPKHLDYQDAEAAQRELSDEDEMLPTGITAREDDKLRDFHTIGEDDDLYEDSVDSSDYTGLRDAPHEEDDPALPETAADVPDDMKAARE